MSTQTTIRASSEFLQERLGFSTMILTSVAKAMQCVKLLTNSSMKMILANTGKKMELNSSVYAVFLLVPNGAKLLRIKVASFATYKEAAKFVLSKFEGSLFYSIQREDVISNAKCH